MMKESHRIVTETLVAGACYLTGQSVSVTVALSLGAYFGSTLPDVDQKIKFIRHRTWTHTIWAVIVLLVLAYYLPAYGNSLSLTGFRDAPPSMRLMYVGFSLGYLCHLLEDSFSWEGILFFYPLKKYSHWHHFWFIKGRKHYFWMYKTGKTEELVIRYVCLVLLLWLWILLLR